MARNTGLSLLFCLVSAVSLHCIHSHESVEHGSFNRHHPHSADSDNHDAEQDHLAVLGSAKKDEEFHKLKPEEAQERLRQLGVKMDVDGDGFVSHQELKKWIYKNFRSINEEQSVDRFEDADTDKDGLVTWSENLAEAWGFSGDEAEQLMTSPDYAEDRLMVREEQLLFEAADADADGKLNKEEFFRFLHPEEFPELRPIILERAQTVRDKDGDGKISWAEYIDGVVSLEKDERSEEANEIFDVEKEHFDTEYDKDGDGFLAGDEIVSWLIPDDQGTAAAEATHLIKQSDDDKDGKLSFDELAAHHDVFVGSEATDYGSQLKDEL